MYHLKIRNEVESIESQKNEFCNSLNGAIEATLFLGSTGGGKTTLIEFLLEKPLSINIKHGNSYLDSMSSNIGNGPNSKTREINLYISDANQLYIDTSGFSDTYGEYTEIKNYFAIENILQCKKIKGFKIGLVLAKSILFYEANRNKDFINFVKSIKNFIPKFGSKEWMNEAFIVVTKTEARTTASDVIKALASAIEENYLDSNEREFFENILNNKKVAIFPLPKEPYAIGETFHDNEAHDNIMQLIRQSAYIPLEKQDFKEFNLSLVLHGEVLKDISTAKIEIAAQINVVMSAIKNQQQQVVTALPAKSFITTNYEKQKKVLEKYLSNVEKLCDSPEEVLNTQMIGDFDDMKELVNNLCELDYSIKFMKKFTAFDDALININDTKDRVIDILNSVIVAYNWKVCTINSYKILFQAFNKNPYAQQKSIDTLLKNNGDASDLFKYNTDKKIALSQLVDQCLISKKEGKEILELASVNENNALNKLAEFIVVNEPLQYHRCKITGNEPSILKIAFDSDDFNGCEEIAIYGRYGIKIDKSIETELKGKNLVMIAPIIKVIGEQKIILSGRDGKEHKVLQASEENDGQAGDPGESSGSFFAYSYFKTGDTLTLYAEGGKGGNGQAGGNGKDGKKGLPDDGYMLQSSQNDIIYSKKLLHDKLEGVTYSWYQVTKYSDNGEPGDKGGNGRTGGEGGKGGLAGQIDFKVLNPEGLEKCIPIISDGLSGDNGIPGTGGEGGKHGDAMQGIWHYPECTPIFFFCGLWTPRGYWAHNHEPALCITQKESALNGESGKSIPFHKSNDRTSKAEILQEKHKAEYVKFILDQENNSVFEFYEDNTLGACDIGVDNQYNCF